MAYRMKAICRWLGKYDGTRGGKVGAGLAALLDLLRPLWLIGIWFVALAAFLGVTQYFWNRLFAPDTYTVTVLNEKGEDISIRFLARQRELLRPTRFDQLHEIAVPNLEGGFAEDIQLIPSGSKLEYKGVDVGAIVKLFDSILQRPPAKMEGKLAESAGTFQVIFTDTDGKNVRPWTLRVPPADQTYEQRIERLTDRAIYRALYYVHFESPLRPKRTAVSYTHHFPSAQALEAYYAGRWHLDAYQTLHNPEELDRAEANLTALRQAMPRFHDGLLLLGLTLTEQRKEDEAITIFEQIEAELASPKDHKERHRLYQAQLYAATAYRKRYRTDDNHVAVTKLVVLCAALESQMKANAQAATQNSDEGKDLKRLEVAARAELVSAVGHYQVHLKNDSFVKDLTKANTPDLVKLADEESKAAAAIKSAADRQALFLKVRERLLGIHNAETAKAKRAIEGLKAQLKADPSWSEDDPSWKTDEAKYLALVKNAHGYTQYRYAEALPDDAKFIEFGKAAIAELREAEGHQPHNYAVLQNLSVVLLDKRFDQKGTYLDEAKRLLERSLILKPRDYYGYQLLAQSTLRRSELWGAETMPVETIKQAVTSAEKARSLRPASKSLLPVLVEAYTTQWEVAPSERATIEIQIQTVLAAAKRLGVPPLLSEPARVRWHVAQVRQSANDADFKKNRDGLVRVLGDLDAALKDAAQTWENRDIARRHKLLETALKNVTFETRKEISWTG